MIVNAVFKNDIYHFSKTHSHGPKTQILLMSTKASLFPSFFYEPRVINATSSMADGSVCFQMPWLGSVNAIPTYLDLRNEKKTRFGIFPEGFGYCLAY